MVRIWCQHPSHNSITWASISTATLGAARHVRRTVSRSFAALRPLSHIRRQITNDCFRSLVVSLVPSRLDYGNFVFVGLPAYLQRRLQTVLLNAAARLVFDFVATTTSLTHWRYCTGCVCQNGSILNWHLWHTEGWTIWRHRIWTNLFLYLACQVVAICGRRSRCSCTSHSTVCQQPAVACSCRSLHFLEHSARRRAVCTVCFRQILVSPVIFWHYNLNFLATTSWTLQRFSLF